MRHYDLVEWKLYKENLLNRNLYQEMKDHLFTCHDCMEIFISLIDHEEVEKAGNLIGDEFTFQLMKDIENINKTTKQNKFKKKKQKYNEILLYYTAVASVAIFLTGAGVFQRLVDRIPHISNNIKNEQFFINTDKINEFSNSILKLTGNFAESFAFKNKEEK